MCLYGETVDTLDSKSSSERNVGSSPTKGTKNKTEIAGCCCKIGEVDSLPV